MRSQIFIFRRLFIALLVCTMLCTTNVSYVFANEEPETGETDPDYKDHEWVEEDGGTRYYEDNSYVTGFKTIDGKKYYFDDHGMMLTGKQTINKSNYYFSKNGVMFTGVRKSNKKLYCYKENGKQVTKKGFFTYKNDEYYCLGKGVLATGWKAITRNKKLNGYYFYKSNGKMAKNTKIGYLKIPKSGKLHEAYALGIQKLDRTKWNIKAAFRNACHTHYYGPGYRPRSAEKSALRGFKKHKGNCYVMASQFYVQAKLLGYNVRQLKGKVAHVSPHSWTQVKHGKKWYVYDPSFNGWKGTRGWRFRYGKKGTWRYTDYKVFAK